MAGVKAGLGSYGANLEREAGVEGTINVEVVPGAGAGAGLGAIVGATDGSGATTGASLTGSGVGATVGAEVIGGVVVSSFAFSG